MGREADINERMRQAQLERVMGPTRPFEYYHRPPAIAPKPLGPDDAPGCPKCRGKQFHTHFCIGRMPLEEPRDGTCTYEGEHLHRMCATCSYGWTEECADKVSG